MKNLCREPIFWLIRSPLQSPNVYGSWAIDLRHWNLLFCHWKICKSTPMIDLHCSFTSVRLQPRSYMLVVNQRKCFWDTYDKKLKSLYCEPSFILIRSPLKWIVNIVKYLWTSNGRPCLHCEPISGLIRSCLQPTKTLFEALTSDDEATAFVALK